MKIPEVLRSPSDIQRWRKGVTGTVGFVPTMGALHSGHESLLKRARSENEFCVLSIFVNPTQFNNSNDLVHYPKTWQSDLALAQSVGADIVWAPTYEAMYPDQYRYKVMENKESLHLCGKDRPGHFDGVLTVVMKLLNVVQPTRAYFGEKDFQQLTLIQDMVGSFFLPYQIVAMPTVREADGLAMSSRNLRLSVDERSLAPQLYKELKAASSAKDAARSLERLGFKIDYVEDLMDRRYAAVRIGEVRLIDNIKI